MNNTDYIILGNFTPFYLRALILFKNSSHVFDDETEIQKVLIDSELYDQDNKINSYQFVNSAANKFIQISDIIVGLLGKCYLFVNETTTGDINRIKKRVNTLTT